MSKITLDLDALLNSGMDKEAILKDIGNTIDKEMEAEAAAKEKEMAIAAAHNKAYDSLLMYYKTVNGKDELVPDKKVEEAEAFLDEFIKPNKCYIKKSAEVDDDDHLVDLWRKIFG